MSKKGRKTAEKKVSTSLWVLQAPESWSKYTTLITAQSVLSQEEIPEEGG